jgi:cell division transport system ATP-binding protein
MVFLMGPTGAGKSTVLRAMIRDIPIESGTLTVNGVQVNRLKKRKIPFFRRNIGMIFQDFKLIKDRTVFENVALPMRIVGSPKKLIREKVMDELRKVGLWGKEKEFPGQLSGGEQQRVSIARAMVNDPVVILADEPTGNLDPIVSDEIIDVLETAAQRGTAVIMSTHNYPLIRPRRKRFIELNKGYLIHQ